MPVDGRILAQAKAALEEKDGRSAKNAAIQNTKKPEKKFGSANPAEIERMQRLLNKIKEE